MWQLTEDTKKSECSLKQGNPWTTDETWNAALCVKPVKGRMKLKLDEIPIKPSINLQVQWKCNTPLGETLRHHSYQNMVSSHEFLWRVYQYYRLCDKPNLWTLRRGRLRRNQITPGGDRQGHQEKSKQNSIISKRKSTITNICKNVPLAASNNTHSPPHMFHSGGYTV